ncbi:MAG TPA: class I SAM-dependent methyltransferase [Patescibacteria group bacterium]|nr:class I SAM-dependent methyltransferase [Patescibacteria group bacterium]
MNIFSYGKVYSKLSINQLNNLKLSAKINSGFSYFAKIYFSLFGYPDIASQRRYLIVEKLLKLKNGDRVLDAGCGNGIYLQEFGVKFNTQGVGIDARRNRVNSAEKINKYLGRDDVFITSTLEKVNLGKRKFNKAICLEVLEHIYDDAGVIKRLSKNLIKGGIFVISVPMKGTALTKEQENDPNFKPVKYEHVRSGYEVSDLKKLARNAGLRVVSIKKYFFFVSRYMVKTQQFLYKNKFTILNLILSPILLVVSELDNIFTFYPRGYILVLKKK